MATHEERISALEERIGDPVRPEINADGHEMYDGEIEWKDELPDADFQPEDWENLTLEEKVEDIRLRLKAFMKAAGYPINKVFSNLQVEDFDVGGKHGPF